MAKAYAEILDSELVGTLEGGPWPNSKGPLVATGCKCRKESEAKAEALSPGLEAESGLKGGAAPRAPPLPPPLSSKTLGVAVLSPDEGGRDGSCPGASSAFRLPWGPVFPKARTSPSG